MLHFVGVLSALALMATLGVQPPPPPKAPKSDASPATDPKNADPKAVRENPLGTTPPPPSNPFEPPQRDELPDLERVPFPLADGEQPGGEGSSSGATETQAQPGKRKVPRPPVALKYADLRDPFATEDRGRFQARPGGAHAVAMMPDLRDPFQVRERPRSKALRQVHLPGDIRDPFAPELTTTGQRPASRCFPPSETGDGVQVQRPRGWTPPEGCPKPQNDLRDPFQNRAPNKK